MMRAPILVLLAGLLLVLSSYLLAFASSPVAPWALATGASLVLTAMLWLGGRRRGSLARWRVVAIVVAGAGTFGGFAYALSAPSAAATGPLLLGFPRTTTIMLLFVGAVPMLALPLLYAASFDDD